MFKDILVPVDGSALAEGTLPYAKVFATRTGATLTLVRAARNPSPLGDVTYDQQFNTIQQAEQYLDALANGLVAEGFKVHTGVAYGGPAADWIVEESQIRHMDLIVMATHDRIGPDRWVRGSVAEGVVHKSTIPVMLVRGANAGELAQRLRMQQPVLVVPLDGSELAETALPLARELVHAFGARVVMIGVVPKPGQLLAGRGGAIEPYGGPMQDEVESEARAYLEASVGRVGSISDVETTLRYGDPARQVAAVAEEYAAAAVIMATHGRSGLTRSILGSVAGGVLHHSCIPVMLIHPPDLRGAEQPLLNQSAATSRS